METGSCSPTGTDTLVVIPCLNERDHIERVIDTVLRDPAAPRLSIAVVDGGSIDGTLGIVARLAAAQPNIRLLANPLRLQGAGVNLAVRLFGAGHRWLIRIDAHAAYPDGYVSELLKQAERKAASSIVVAVTSRGANCLQQATAVAQNSFLGAGGAPHRGRGREGFVEHGHHALFDMKVFLALGGYDETQSHNEDAELDYRLVRAGGCIWLTLATHMIYFPRSRAADLYLQYRNYGHGRGTTMLRHRMRPRLRQIIPAAVAPAAALALATPWIPLAGLPLALWLASCAGFGVILGSRKRSRCAFASGGAAAMIHLAWSIGFWSALTEAALGALPWRGRRVAQAEAP